MAHDDPSRAPPPGAGPGPDLVEDLSDMLTVIMGNLELLSRQELAPRAARQLARASLAAHHAGRLLRGGRLPWRRAHGDRHRDMQRGADRPEAIPP